MVDMDRCGRDISKVFILLFLFSFFEVNAQDGQNSADFERYVNEIYREGWALSTYAAYGQTLMKTPGQSDLPTDNPEYPWEIIPGFGFGAGVQANYFLSYKLCLISGINYNGYHGIYRLEGHYEDTELSKDLNGDDYYKNLQMDYDSSLSHHYISLPVLLSYTSSKPGKYGLYFEAGASLDLRLTSTYEVSGDEQLYGHYPNYPPIIEYLYLEELGFYDREDVYRTGEPELKYLNISAYLSMGIVIPLGYLNSFKLGPEVYLGVSDVNKGIETYSIYGEIISHMKTALRKFGVKFSYVLKL